MTAIDFLLKEFRENAEKDAIIWEDRSYSYGWLLGRIAHWQSRIKNKRVPRGSVAVLEADFSPTSVALFLALTQSCCILVPMVASMGPKKAEFIKLAQGEVSFHIDRNDEVRVETLPYAADHAIYSRLRELDHPGVVVFSSASTGKSKAIVHDMSSILRKFTVRRHALRAITFLLYDHLGGINTMLYQLSNSGCIVAVSDRNPDNVLRAVERHKVDLLPTTPTFINLILLSEAFARYDLSSLKTISYGTEPMLESTLKRLHQVLPDVRLLQTYGLTELGVLRSSSRSSDSLWVKVGGEGFETRVVDGILHVKAESAMLGYLNAPSPFTDDGWLNTGDLVDVDGKFIRFLGRTSDIINVGGEKVFPAEVESVIQELENVAEVTVYAEKNQIVGNIVCATVRLISREDTAAFTRRLKTHCMTNLARYKVPVKVVLSGEDQHSNRFKKVRPVGDARYGPSQSA